MRNLTPVILQAGLKEALTEGGIVEAHSVEDAKKVGNTWTGNWRIYLRIGDQRLDRRLHQLPTTTRASAFATIRSSFIRLSFFKHTSNTIRMEPGFVLAP